MGFSPCFTFKPGCLSTLVRYAISQLSGKSKLGTSRGNERMTWSTETYLSVVVEIPGERDWLIDSFHSVGQSILTDLRSRASGVIRGTTILGSTIRDTWWDIFEDKFVARARALSLSPRVRSIYSKHVVWLGRLTPSLSIARARTARQQYLVMLWESLGIFGNFWVICSFDQLHLVHKDLIRQIGSLRFQEVFSNDDDKVDYRCQSYSSFENLDGNLVRPFIAFF